MNANLTVIIAIAGGLLILIAIVVGLIIRTRKRRAYPAIVHQKWLDIQRLCASKDTWTKAVIDADKLLEEALKKKHFKGKSIGERLVSAQRKLSDNDSIWYAHNMAKKLIAKPRTRLKESDVKKALIGFRQALRDIGVLNDKK